MATATVETPRMPATNNQTNPSKAANFVPPKIGLFGAQGSGKSTTAALLAVALSKEVHGGAPVYVTDTEPGWQFLRPRIFKVEGVELIQRTVPTYKAMVDNLREAERVGACVWAIDSLTIIWQELMQSFKAKNGGYIPIDKWGDIKQMWNQYTTFFLNSKMTCMALGRLGNEQEEVQDENNPNRTKLVKVGTKLKAGGSESFGYEPHLLLELSLERKAKVKAGSKLEGEGRMIHRVEVLKDRTWALNGKIIRWHDKNSYQKGDYKTVWNSLFPHINALQEAGGTQLLPGDSTSAIAEDGSSVYYARRKERDILVEEMNASMQLLWGGQGQAEKRMRMLVGETLFGVRSQAALAEMDLDKVQRGVSILQAFEKRVKADGMPTSESGVLNALQIDVDAYDTGSLEPEAAPEDNPF